jgi:hypothetical protein
MHAGLKKEFSYSEFSTLTFTAFLYTCLMPTFIFLKNRLNAYLDSEASSKVYVIVHLFNN